MNLNYKTSATLMNAIYVYAIESFHDYMKCLLIDNVSTTLRPFNCGGHVSHVRGGGGIHHNHHNHQIRQVRQRRHQAQQT